VGAPGRGAARRLLAGPEPPRLRVAGRGDGRAADELGRLLATHPALRAGAQHGPDGPARAIREVDRRASPGLQLAGLLLRAARAAHRGPPRRAARPRLLLRIAGHLGVRDLGGETAGLLRFERA